MSLEQAYFVTQIFAVFLIVGSLLFVGFQMRQTHAVERANGQRDLLNQARDLWRMMGQDKPTFDAIQKCVSNYDGASDYEKAKFHIWAISLVGLTEQSFYQHKEGLIPESLFQAFERSSLSVLTTRGGAQWWRESQAILGSDISSHLNARTETFVPHASSWMDNLSFMTGRESADDRLPERTKEQKT